jgi:hypothetical protein
MKWIEDETRFQEALQSARDCAATDSGRLPTALRKLTFNDVDLCSDPFAGLLQSLLEWSGDVVCSFVVLRPDPVYYFHHFFMKYPLIEVPRGMSADEFLRELDEGPPDSKADALGIIYREYVVVPPSQRWFIHALRSARNDGGHLWVPAEWVDRVVAIYPYATVIDTPGGGTLNAARCTRG